MLTPGDAASALLRETATLRAAFARRDAQTLRDQISITKIAAPTGGEEARAGFISRRFAALGLDGPRYDAAGNVLATQPGLRDVPPVVVCAHMDTVFPAGTSLKVLVDKESLRAPGIGDNARGVAALIALAETFAEYKVITHAPITYVATTGEEGEGDLRGMKCLLESGSDAAAVIVLDGPGDTRIVNSAIGCARFRVTFTGAGGHSWSAHGVPNPAHAAGLVTAMVSRVKLPTTPRTAMNVTRIAGGTSVNSIPANAWIEVDIRSAGESVIAHLATELARAARAALETTNGTRRESTPPLELQIELLGRRPCGSLDETHPLAATAIRFTEMVGREPELCAASTDANLPLSLGIPAIAIGAGGRGGAAHTLQEWYENRDGALGVARAALIVLAAADGRLGGPHGQIWP